MKAEMRALAHDLAKDSIVTDALAQFIAQVIEELHKTKIAPAKARALAAEAERDALRALICRVEPHIDAIVCYASAMGEHEPNRIAHEVRSIASGGVLRAAETGWLIELRGSAPSWAIVNPRDYDEHWTADSTRALRFARREDAQAYIDHIGWTEAFPSEHIWDDGRTHSDATRTEQP